MRFVSSKGEKGEGVVIDLSLRGVRFLSGSVLHTGDKIRTAFQPGKEITLDLAGIIRHTHRKSAKRWIYGVEFFIQDYRDLKEHLKLNSYIIRARAEQDHLLQKKLMESMLSKLIL